jgi:hypothetical protein
MSLLQEQPNSPSAGYPTNSKRSTKAALHFQALIASGFPGVPSPHISFPSMPGAFPGGVAWGQPDSGIPFPPPGEPSRRPYNPAASPPTSQSSWHSPNSSHTAGSGSTNTNGNAHWASLIFNSRHGSTPFPKKMSHPSTIYARPLGNMFLRLEDDNFELVSRV